MITEKEFNIAVKEYSRNLYRYFLKTLRDDQIAKDLVQDVFLKLWTNKDKIDWNKVKSWLFTVAHNSLMNYLQQNKKLSDVDLEKPIQVSNCVFQEMEDKELVEMGLNSLSPLHKSIVVLRDLEGYNYQEIGEMLQLNESQVKVYLFRARLKMKESIQQLMAFYEKGS